MSIISRASKRKHVKIKNINDEKFREFDSALNKVLLNLAKRVVSDGEGASKFVSIFVQNCKNEDTYFNITFRFYILVC